MREQTNTLKIINAVAPGTYAADATPVEIDRLGFGSITFAIGVGVGGITFSGTNKIEFKLEASDDGDTWAPVPASQIAGLEVATDDGIVLAFKTAHAAASEHQFGYIGDARHLRITPDFSGTHGTGTGLSVVAVLGRSLHSPAA
ncbi:MAG: hypothetical protein ACRED4_02020 [Brevundimonas sp.]